MKNQSTMIIVNAKNHSSDQPSTSPNRKIHESKILLCIWRGMKGVVYYELLKSNQTVTERYQQQLIDLNRALNKKRPIIAQRKRKVILLHDNA